MPESNLIDAKKRFENKSNQTESNNKKELLNKIKNHLKRMTYKGVLNLPVNSNHRDINIDLNNNEIEILVTKKDFQFTTEEQEKYEQEINRRLDFIDSVKLKSVNEKLETNTETDIDQALTESSLSGFPASSNREIEITKSLNEGVNVKIIGDFTSEGFFRNKEKYEERVLKSLNEVSWLPYKINNVSLSKEVLSNKNHD